MINVSWELLIQIARNSGGYIDVDTGMIYRNQPGKKVARSGAIKVPYINGFYILHRYLKEQGLLRVVKEKYSFELIKQHENTYWFDYFYVDYTPEEKRFLDIVHDILDDDSGRISESDEFYNKLSAQIIQRWCRDNRIEAISIPYAHTEAVYALLHGLTDMSQW